MLQDNDFEFEQELSYAKIRMERRKDLEEKYEEMEPPLLEVPEGAGEQITKYSGREKDQNGEKSECDQKRSKSETGEAFQGSCKGDQEKEKNNREEQEAEELRLEEEEAKSRQTFDPISKT